MGVAAFCSVQPVHQHRCTIAMWHTEPRDGHIMTNYVVGFTGPVLDLHAERCGKRILPNLEPQKAPLRTSIRCDTTEVSSRHVWCLCGANTLTNDKDNTSSFEIAAFLGGRKLCANPVAISVCFPQWRPQPNMKAIRCTGSIHFWWSEICCPERAMCQRICWLKIVVAKDMHKTFIFCVHLGSTW